MYPFACRHYRNRLDGSVVAASRSPPAVARGWSLHPPPPAPPHMLAHSARLCTSLLYRHPLCLSRSLPATRLQFRFILRRLQPGFRRCVPRQDSLPRHREAVDVAPSEGTDGGTRVCLAVVLPFRRPSRKDSGPAASTEDSCREVALPRTVLAAETARRRAAERCSSPSSARPASSLLASLVRPSPESARRRAVRTTCPARAVPCRN